MVRTPCCDKTKVSRGPWTSEEDDILTEYVMKHGRGCWRNVPTQAGLLRCGKSCRFRWTNYLRPNLKLGNITKHEEKLIITLHKLLGNRWALIAARLPGRTDNEIKNYWNTKLKTKFKKMGIDIHTYEPFPEGENPNRYKACNRCGKNKRPPPLPVHSSTANYLLEPMTSLPSSLGRAEEQPMALVPTSFFRAEDQPMTWLPSSSFRPEEQPMTSLPSSFSRAAESSSLQGPGLSSQPSVDMMGIYPHTGRPLTQQQGHEGHEDGFRLSYDENTQISYEKRLPVPESETIDFVELLRPLRSLSAFFTRAVESLQGPTINPQPAVDMSGIKPPTRKTSKKKGRHESVVPLSDMSGINPPTHKASRKQPRHDGHEGVVPLSETLDLLDYRMQPLTLNSSSIEEPGLLQGLDPFTWIPCSAAEPSLLQEPNQNSEEALSIIDSFLADAVIGHGELSEVLPELEKYSQSVGSTSSGSIQKSLWCSTQKRLSVLSPYSPASGPASILGRCSFGCTTDHQTGSLCSHLLSNNDLRNYSDLEFADGHLKQRGQQPGHSPFVTSASTACSGFMPIHSQSGQTQPSIASHTGLGISCHAPNTTLQVGLNENHGISIEQLSSFMLDDVEDQILDRSLREEASDHSSSTTTGTNFSGNHLSIWDMEIDLHPMIHSSSAFQAPDVVEDVNGFLISTDSLEQRSSGSHFPAVSHLVVQPTPGKVDAARGKAPGSSKPRARRGKAPAVPKLVRPIARRAKAQDPPIPVRPIAMFNQSGGATHWSFPVH